MTAQPSIDSSFSVINESLLGDLELSVEKYIRSLPQHVVAIRDNFITNWDELVQINRNKAISGKRTSRSAHAAQSKESKDEVYRSLSTHSIYTKKI